MTESKYSFTLPGLQSLIGIVLLVGVWGLSWLPEFLDAPDTLRTHMLFFPLWLGYILVIDDLVWLRKGTSLLRRNWRAFVALFVISAPVWWLFEVLNWRTQNWEYIGRERFTDLEYFLLASVAFSTVIPAVFSTAELVSTFGWLKRLRRGPVIKPTQRTLTFYLLTGVAMLVLTLVLPRYFFPFIWLGPYFILAPINAWLGNRSLFDSTQSGNWRPVVALWLGTLICGFFWELWNYYSYPKWIYHVPFVGVLHIFEMPALGYGGYLPFGLELFALYHFVLGVAGKRESLNDYVQLESGQTGAHE